MISIVIPTYNQHSMTADCIEAVRENTTDYEIILVDNGSDIPFANAAIRNEKNLGFPVAVNQGCRAAKGETIILLNNDVVVTKNWFERLEWHLLKYDIVGPMTNFCAGLQRVTIPVYHDEKELNQRAIEFQVANAFRAQEVNWVIGFCMAFKKSLWEEIGPFDESIWPCSGEEIDFCMRAKSAGHKIGIAKDVYVHHEGSQTFKEMEKTGQVNYQESCKRNDIHLAEKWGDSVFKQEIEKPACEDAPGGAIKINLGSGLRRMEGFINIDNRPEVSPDIVCDITGGLPFDDSSVDRIRAFDVLEHVPLGKTLPVIEEIYRVLKPGGIFESFTPSTDGRGSFQDPTHLSFWNKNSWLYYSDHDCRELYGTKANFELVKNEDVTTNAEWKIIHTHVIAKARKVL